MASIKLGQGHKTEQKYRKEVEALMSMLTGVQVDDVDVRELDFIRHQDKQRLLVANATKKYEIEQARVADTMTKKDSVAMLQARRE